MSARTRNAVALGFAVLTAAAFVKAQARPNIQPKEGYVPNAETAVTIGVAVFHPIFGSASVNKDTPYTASLADGIWTVRGTLPPGVTGGTAVAEIAKSDGRIIRVFHEQ